MSHKFCYFINFHISIFYYKNIIVIKIWYSKLFSLVINEFSWIKFFIKRCIQYVFLFFYLFFTFTSSYYFEFFVLMMCETLFFAAANIRRSRIRPNCFELKILKEMQVKFACFTVTIHYFIFLITITFRNIKKIFMFLRIMITFW